MILNLTKKYIFTALVILLACSPAVFAQADDDSNLSMQVPDVRLIKVEPAYLEFGPSMADMVNGWTETQQVTAYVSANADWMLMIKGASEVWEGPYQKPVSDIYWSLAGRDSNPLSTESSMIISGGLCRDSEYPINIQIMLDVSRDLPGNYHYYNVIFEMVEP